MNSLLWDKEKLMHSILSCGQFAEQQSSALITRLKMLNLNNLLVFLTYRFAKHQKLRCFALNTLFSCKADTIQFYLPQFFQSLRYSDKGLLSFLVLKALESNNIAHYIL